LNYRHAFHAGSFADVLKHVVLVRTILHLLKKETPFRVIETHAGAGRYDLSGDKAARTGEWRGGIGRLFERPLTGEAAELIEPYLSLVRAANSGDALKIYPGSPLIARTLLRPQDRMIFCELHPEERAALVKNTGRDRRAKIVAIDGWAALKAYVPPKERRGLVLIDPPFEAADEFARLEAGLLEAQSRWATGILLAWYPIKEPRETQAFARRLSRSGIAKILRIEFAVAAQRPGERLTGCGMIAINPPWILEREMSVVFPQLAKSLAQQGSGNYRVDWLAGGR
jgi:23S rRNA (adenine2030-N6)-methyltransferase